MRRRATVPAAARNHTPQRRKASIRHVREPYWHAPFLHVGISTSIHQLLRDFQMAIYRSKMQRGAAVPVTGGIGDEWRRQCAVGWGSYMFAMFTFAPAVTSSFTTSKRPFSAAKCMGKLPFPFLKNIQKVTLSGAECAAAHHPLCPTGTDAAAAAPEYRNWATSRKSFIGA